MDPKVLQLIIVSSSVVLFVFLMILIRHFRSFLRTIYWVFNWFFDLFRSKISIVNSNSRNYLMNLGYPVAHNSPGGFPVQRNALVANVNNDFLVRFNNGTFLPFFNFCIAENFVLIHNLEGFLQAISPIPNENDFISNPANGIVSSSPNYYLFSNNGTPTTSNGTAPTSAGPKKDGFDESLTNEYYHDVLDRNDYLHMVNVFQGLIIPPGATTQLVGYLDSGFDPTSYGIQRLSPLASFIHGYGLGLPNLNVLNNTRDIVDNCGHGSRIFELLNSHLSNNQPGLHILPIKVLDGNGVCTVADLICGINLAAIYHVDYLNISIGYYSGTLVRDASPINSAIELYLQGHPQRRIFASAGNDQIHLTTRVNHFPSGYAFRHPEMFEVFAFEENRNIGFFERYFSWLFIPPVLEHYSNRRSSYVNAFRASGKGFTSASDITSFFDYKNQHGTSFSCPRALAAYSNNPPHYVPVGVPNPQNVPQLVP